MPGLFGWWGASTREVVPAAPDWDQCAATPLEARMYCPGCEPEIDPIIECVSVLYCEAHYPAVRGQIDLELEPLKYDQAGGENNREACAFFHRNRSKET